MLARNALQTLSLTTLLLGASCGLQEPLRAKRTQVGKVWVDLPEGWQVTTDNPVAIYDPDKHAVIQMSFRETEDSTINVAIELDEFLSSKFTDEQVKKVEKVPGSATAEVVTDLYWFVRFMSIRGSEVFVTLLCAVEGQHLSETEQYREVVRSIGWTE